MGRSAELLSLKTRNTTPSSVTIKYATSKRNYDSYLRIKETNHHHYSFEKPASHSPYFLPISREINLRLYLRRIYRHVGFNLPNSEHSINFFFAISQIICFSQGQHAIVNFGLVIKNRTDCVILTLKIDIINEFIE